MKYTIDEVTNMETRLFKLIDMEKEMKLKGKYHADSIAGMNNLSQQITDLIITYSRAVATC